MERLAEGSQDARSSAAWCLWREEGSPEAVGGLARALLKDDSPEVCLYAARALAERAGSRGAAEALAKAYTRFRRKKGREEIRFWCVWGLSRHKKTSRRFLSTLRAAAADPDEAVCLQALLGIDHAPGRGRDEILRKTFRSHKSERVRSESARRLSLAAAKEAADSRAVRGLRRTFLAGGSVAARIQAAARLGETGSKAAVPVLVEVCRDKAKPGDLRLAGVRALGRLGSAGADAVAALSVMAEDDPRIDVSAEAGRSLQRIKRAMARVVGASLRKAREGGRRTVSTETAAELVGVPKKAFEHWESGHALPDRRHWDAILARLGPGALAPLVPPNLVTRDMTQKSAQAEKEHLERTQPKKRSRRAKAKAPERAGPAARKW